MKITKNMKATNRTELQEAIASIPSIKRFFICTLLRRKQWKTARAYSIVTMDMLYSDHPDAHKMWEKSDELWAKLYDIDYTPKSS
jgi:hypothetical protein